MTKAEEDRVHAIESLIVVGIAVAVVALVLAYDLRRRRRELLDDGTIGLLDLLHRPPPPDRIETDVDEAEPVETPPARFEEE